jgi:uncharacterized protein YjbI with pentapeptide repeats
MGARLRSWWQYIRKHWRVAIIIALVIAAMALIFIESMINGTGFNGYYAISTTRTISGPPHTITSTETYQPGKTLWDWLQLLFIPVVLAIAGFWFNHRERKAAELRADTERKAAEVRAKNERDIAEDDQREAALQAYINEMSELLLHANLRMSMPEDEVRKIARVRTLTVLPRLDGQRKGNIIQFLYESGLINKDKRIIDLGGADLREVNLRGSRLAGVILAGASLGKANLKEAFLSEANLMGADLFGVNLKFAYLGEALMIGVKMREADLSAANLGGADLSSANLMEVHMRGAYLNKADLRGANLIKADLRNTNLLEAEFGGAILDGANLFRATGTTPELLNKAESLKDTIMPDGSIHP